MSNEKTPIWTSESEAGGDNGKGTGNLGATGGAASGPGAIYHDSTQSPKAVSSWK